MSFLHLPIVRPVVRLLGLPLESHDKSVLVDAIIVLGVPLQRDGTLSLAGSERVREGVRLWQSGIAPLLVFSGGAIRGDAEAPAMASVAMQLGVPRDAIITEDKSRNTAENARYSARLLRKRDVRHVRIVSQPFHLRRGRRLFRRQGLKADACSFPHSVQYQRPELAARWVVREYMAWIAHFVLWSR